MSPTDPVERVVALLHEAALNDDKWLEAAREISRFCRSRGHAEVLVEGGSPADAEVFRFRIHLHGEHREDWERRYFEGYFRSDERVRRIAQLPHGRLVRTGDLYTDREKTSAPAYNEALRHMNSQHGLHVRMDGRTGQKPSVVWAFADSTEPGGWGSDQVALIERLLPHLRQFVITRQTLAEAGALGASIAGMLDSTGLGLIHLDRRGRIVATNDRALTFLRERSVLTDAGGVLRARVPSENTELARLTGCALPPYGARGSAGSMTLGRTSSGRSLALHITPRGDRSDARSREVAALVLIVDPGSETRIDPALVGAVLGLTPAESEVATELAAGRTLSDIAGLTGRSKQTVRWHLKRIFDKQGVTRQVDLVRRVLTLGGMPTSRR